MEAPIYRSSSTTRLTLRVNADVPTIMNYFFYRFGNGLESVTFRTIKNQPREAARLIKSVLTKPQILKLLEKAKAVVTKLKSKRAQTRLIKYIIPIYKLAAGARQRTKKTPSTAPIKRTPGRLTWRKVFPELIGRFGGSLSKLKAGDLSDLDKVARLIHGQLSKTETRKFEAEITKHIKASDSISPSFQRQLKKLLEAIKRSRALALTKGTSTLSLEEKNLRLAFETTGLSIEPPLKEESVGEFAMDWRQSMPKVSDQIQVMVNISHSISTLNKIEKKLRKRLRISLKKLSSQMTEAFRINNPRFHVPAGMTLSEDGVLKYFFKVYGRPFTAPRWLKRYLYYEPATEEVSRNIYHSVAQKEWSRKLKELTKLKRNFERYKSKLNFDSGLVKAIFRTYTIYKEASKYFSQNKGASQNKGKTTTTKMKPTTAPDRGEDNPNNLRNTPPNDSYFVRFMDRNSKAKEFPGELRSIPLYNYPYEYPFKEVLAHFFKVANAYMALGKDALSPLSPPERGDPRRWVAAYRSGKLKGIDVLTNAVFNQLAANGLVKPNTLSKLVSIRKRANQGYTGAYKSWVEGVYQLAELNKNKRPKATTSFREDIDIQKWQMTSEVEKMCRDYVAEAKRILMASSIPKAKLTLKGRITFKRAMLEGYGGLYHYQTDTVTCYLRGRQGVDVEPSLETLLHELGHRYHYLYMNKNVWLEWLLYTKMINAPRKPWVGKRIVYDGIMPFGVGRGPIALDRGTIIDVSTASDDEIVEIRTDFDEIITRRWSELETLRENIAWDYPSRYARTNPSEHFCETWTGYHLGLLAEDLRDNFESLLIRKQPASNIKIASKDKPRLLCARYMGELLEHDNNMVSSGTENITMGDIMRTLVNEAILFESLSFNGSYFKVYGAEYGEVLRIETLLSDFYDATVEESVKEPGTLIITVPQ